MASSARRPNPRELGSLGWSGWAKDAPDATKYLAEIRAKLDAKAGPLPRRTRAKAIDLELPTVDPDVIARREREKARLLEQARALAASPARDEEAGG